MAAPQDPAKPLSAATLSPAAAAPAGTAQPQASDSFVGGEPGLDAEAAASCHRLAGLLFPWDLTRSLELALLKTFCVPSIAALLDRSGEFARQPRKRYDDTGLMVAELLRHGPDSPAGAAVIARMNRIHGHYAIANDDFVYVLSTFVAEPIRWLERYGWRPLSTEEQQALHRFWQRVGERMGIAAIPPDLEALLAFNQAFEAERFTLAPANGRVAEATLMMLLRDWPPPLRPLIRLLLQALPEATVNASLGWPQAPAALQGLIRWALRVRSRLANGWQRLVPPRGSRFYSERPTPSYGASFHLEQLGPPPMLERLNRPRWIGSQRRIGLTGGIASGKSSVGRLLAAQGLPLLDADVYAREALAPGTPGARAVIERYGDRVALRGHRAPGAPAQASGQGQAAQGIPAGAEGTAAADACEGPRAFAGRSPAPRVSSGDASPSSAAATAIDRAALGRIVFSDTEERRWLEQLVHPLVRQRFEAELQRCAAAPALVLVIPLLFETGLEALCSEVWLVDCEPEQQLQRLMQRDGLGLSDARARLSAQWPLERKRPLADRLIDNRGEPQALVAAVAAGLRAGADRSAAAPPPA
jgi:dephospho-CoA kinase